MLGTGQSTGKEADGAGRKTCQVAVCLLFTISLSLTAESHLEAQSPGVIYQLPNTPNGPQARTRAELDAFGHVMEAKKSASIIVAVEAFASRYPQSQLLPMVRLREMRAEMDVNSYEGAISIGRELLLENPRNLEALLLMAAILPDFPPRYAAQRKVILAEARKDTQSAEQILRTLHLPQGASPEEFIIEKRRMRASLAQAQGFSDLVAGEYHDAIAKYNWALAHGSDPSPVTSLRLGEAYLEAGDLAKARDQLQQAMNSTSSLIRQRAEQLLKKTASAQGALNGVKPKVHNP